jgi:hypothetical protein
MVIISFWLTLAKKQPLAIDKAAVWVYTLLLFKK